MRIYLKILLMVVVVFCSLTSLVISGEWPEEELRKIEEERQAFEENYNLFNSKGIHYQLWLKISRSNYACTNDDQVLNYDYFPASGLRGFYCHLKSFINMETIEKFAGIKIFLSGPHDNNKPNLNSRSDFGHYNPDFLLWAQNTLIPAKTDSAFLAFSQYFYNDYFSSLLRAYYVTGVILQGNDEFRTSLKLKYKETMSSGKNYGFYNRGYYFIKDHLPPEYNFLKGSDFTYPQFERYSFNGNIVKTGLYFWLRRDMDGTLNKVLEVMEDILRLYDKEFFNEFIHVRDIGTYYRLASNLDKKFQPADLKMLSKFQLSLLRNGIFATYGYRFQSPSFQLYFQDNIHKFCRKKQCGVVSETYDEKNLTSIDKYNINIIKNIEDLRDVSDYVDILFFKG